MESSAVQGRLGMHPTTLGSIGLLYVVCYGPQMDLMRYGMRSMDAALFYSGRAARNGR